MKETEPDTALHLDVNNLPTDLAVTRLVEHAAALPASDLCFTSNDGHVAVAARHMGVMRLISILNDDLGRRCITHIKAVANMNMTERRRPLDGRWFYKRTDGGLIDLRINTLPTLYGEDCTMRILPRDSPLLAVDHLGFLQQDYNQLLRLMHSPGGLILVTGPAGSGKTTTLYACLTYLNVREKKLHTIEDPVEYALTGVRQSQVNPAIGLGFPELLRSVLRQAPDIIMIGEVRDAETAEIAVRAANSGHLVLATLHAPVAAGAIQSMLSLGIHPHFLASSLLGVIAQRLVRTLCKHCKRAFDLTESVQTFDEVRPWLEEGEGQVLYAAKGCKQCHNLGYVGQTGVFEVLPLTRAVQKLIVNREPTQAIRHKAIEEGMIEFRRAALIKVAQGVTSVEEVFRAVPSEYLAVDE